MTKPFTCVAIGIAIAMSATSVEAKSKTSKHNQRAIHTSYYTDGADQRLTQSISSPRVQRYRKARSVRHKATTRHRHASRNSADRSCLVPAAKQLLTQIEQKFGPVQVISTCRRGAIIAGTNKPSLHRYGMAFDFKTKHKAAVVGWLAENNTGGTMTYRHSDHIHADVGKYRFVSLPGARNRTRIASAPRIHQVSASRAAARRVARATPAAANLDRVYAMDTSPQQTSGGVFARLDYAVIESNERSYYAAQSVVRPRYARQQRVHTLANAM